MTGPAMTWRYGMYLEEFGGPGGTAQGFTPEGCRNLLGHQMEQMHHGSGSCTCGQYRKDRLRRPVPESKQCGPCRELQAAKDQLKTQTEVRYLQRVWYYQEEPTHDR